MNTLKFEYIDVNLGQSNVSVSAQERESLEAKWNRKYAIVADGLNKRGEFVRVIVSNDGTQILNSVLIADKAALVLDLCRANRN